MSSRLFALLAAGIGTRAEEHYEEERNRTMTIQACYPKQVYVDFVEGRIRTNPTQEEFVTHLDSCHVCQQAVRQLEKNQASRRPAGWP
jgi:hypothetical protein